MPPGNRMFYYTEVPFSAEGFYSLDVKLAIQGMGYSGAEVNRLFASNAIKTWDTRVTQDGNHFEWYKRTSRKNELVEKGDVFIVGKRYLTINAGKVFPLKRLFWYLRPYVERYVTDRFFYKEGENG